MADAGRIIRALDEVGRGAKKPHRLGLRNFGPALSNGGARRHDGRRHPSAFPRRHLWEPWEHGRSNGNSLRRAPRRKDGIRLSAASWGTTRQILGPPSLNRCCYHETNAVQNCLAAGSVLVRASCTADSMSEEGSDGPSRIAPGIVASYRRSQNCFRPRIRTHIHKSGRRIAADLAR
jgi:hypothetical protein